MHFLRGNANAPSSSMVSAWKDEALSRGGRGAEGYCAVLAQWLPIPISGTLLAFTNLFGLRILKSNSVPDACVFPGVRPDPF
jgi:hypothetical protein